MARKTPPKQKAAGKPSLGRRVGARIRSVGLVGADAVKNPRGIPASAHGAFRGWFRRIWDTRGGSAYTLGYALTFAALEARTLIGEVAGMTSAGDFFAGQLVEFLMRFSTESVTNLVLAFMWPVFVVSWYPPWGAGLFVVALLTFPRFVKPYVERWLFRGERAGNDSPDP